MRGGNGRLSKRQLSFLCLFGCLLDGLLRFLHHSHLLWFVLSPRQQIRRGQVTERTIVCRGSNDRLIKVTREWWVIQSIDTENTNIEGIVNRFRAQRRRLGREDIRNRVATEGEIGNERRGGFSVGVEPSSPTGRMRTCVASGRCPHRARATRPSGTEEAHGSGCGSSCGNGRPG